LPPPEKVGIDAAERTLALFGGKKIKTETLPIIVENRIVPRIGDGLMQAMSAAPSSRNSRSWRTRRVSGSPASY